MVSVCAPVTTTSAYFTHTNKPNTYTVPFRTLWKYKNSAKKKSVQTRNVVTHHRKLKFCHFHSISFGFLAHYTHGNQWHFFILLLHWFPCAIYGFAHSLAASSMASIKWAVASAFVVLNDWQLFSISLQTSITIDLTFHLMILFEQWFTHT